MTKDSTPPRTSTIDSRELRRCLTRLFDRKESIRRLATEAGLAMDRVALDGGAADAWFTVVDEALKSGQIEALVTLALEAYPNETVLLRVQEELTRANASTPSALLEPTRTLDAAPPVAEPSPRPGPVASFDPRHAYFFVPFRAKGEAVIGRAEALEKVRRQLVEGRRTAIGQTASFSGLGGLGKTQLAVEYAHAWREHYPGGVYWFTADGDLDGQLARLAREARWVSPDSEARFQLEIAVHQVRTRSDCLIIFDNVEQREQIEPLLPEQSASPHLLLTSRLPQHGFHLLALDRLDESLSLRMLASESSRNFDLPEDRAAARSIVSQLDGLPLALELVGAYLRRYPGAELGDYARQLEAKGIQVRALRESLKHESFTRHEEGLHATLRIGERVLEETPRLRDVLDLLAWSGSASMGRQLIAAALALEPVELTESLDVAVSLRILRREDASRTRDEPRYQMHRLVREVRRLDVPFEVHLERWAAVPRRLGDWFEQRRTEFRELDQFEAEIDHLDAWQSHAQLMGQAREAARLQWLRAYPPFHRGQHRQSQAPILRALETFGSAKVEDRPLLAHLLNDLGVTTGNAGEHRKALEYKEQALAIRREVLGDRHPDTANSLNSVGASFSELGEHRKALSYKAQALAIRREVLGERHPDTATSLNNVGASFRDLGEHHKALEYGEKALTIRREVLGERHPDTATSFNNVGASFRDLGEHRRALEYAEKALTIRREVLGEQHPDTASSLNNVGASFSDLGEYRKTLEYAEKALTIRREVLGEQHPDTAGSLNNVAASFSDLGEHRKTLEYAEKALAILREVLGEQHPETIFTRRSVAICLIGLNKKVAAYQMVVAGLKHSPNDRELRRLKASLGGRPSSKTADSGKKKR